MYYIIAIMNSSFETESFSTSAKNCGIPPKLYASQPKAMQDTLKPIIEVTQKYTGLQQAICGIELP